jgi:hypothetical protein
MNKVPWEPVNQITPDEMSGLSAMHPGPWSCFERGNGHIDVFDANNGYVAHVYCWDSSDYNLLANNILKTQNPIKKD